MQRITDIQNRLISDFGFKQRGKYLREGVCPKCEQKSLFIKADEPNNVKCGRVNKCDYSTMTRELYPDLWQTLEQRFPATQQDPNATAKAYLRSRGIDPVKCVAEFVQGQRFESEAISDPKGTSTVKFTLPNGSTWERFIQVIEMPDKPKKAHFTGGYAGYWWQPSNFDPQRGQQVFLVEGIIDALSLIQSGFHAVALMSCNNWPERSLKAYLDKGIKWVVALDNDDAGQRYNHQFYKDLLRLNERAEVCIAPEKDKRDWNDLLKACKGNIGRDDIEAWFYTGSLLTSANAKNKALKIAERTHRTSFTFDFKDQLYFAKYSEKEEENPIQIENIANCKPEFVYFQKDTVTEESAYFLKISRPGTKKPYKAVFAASALATPSEFKNRLLNVAPGLMFTGGKRQLEMHQKEYWFSDAHLPEVQTVGFLGYAKELGGWVFQGQAVFDGKLYKANENDFFDLPDDKQVKTSFRQDNIHIGSVDSAHNPDLWLSDYKQAFGVKGLAALAYWVGSFFAEQIRGKQASYPFLEMSGEPGTGKSTVLEFLWKLTGRADYEGIELSKASHAGRWRSLEQLANLPLVLMEGDRSEATGKQKGAFDLNEAKGLYNGRGMRSVGMRTGGNETREPRFRGALVIAQNASVDSERAVMERINRIHWDKTHLSTAGYDAASRLRELDLEAINGFMTACITQESLFLEKYQEGYDAALSRLNDHAELGNQRIRHNHAQVMAIAHALKATKILEGLLPSDLEDLDNYIEQSCVDRHQCLEADTPLLSEFWDVYQFLEYETHFNVNHSKEEGKIAISIPQFTWAMAEVKQKPIDMTQLKKELKNSKRFPYLDRKSVRSKIKDGSPVMCYVFTDTEAQQRGQQYKKAA